MPRISETLALNLIEDGLNTLRQQYSVAGGAENRRDQIKPFLTQVFSSIERLVEAAEGDPAYAGYSLPTIMEDIDAAFIDRIEAEDSQQKRVNPAQDWGTLHVAQGRVA